MPFITSDRLRAPRGVPGGALRTARLFVAAVLSVAIPAEGGQSSSPETPPTGASAPSLTLSLVPDAPSVPVAPATISRDAEGRATVRAVRVQQPLRIDGALDESHYREVPAMSGFIQIEPRPGDPATEDTDVWVSFDRDNVYVSARLWDSELDRLVATEMRRDSNVLFQGNDVISFVFDTFYDRRNAVLFTVNPIAGRSDSQVTNERQFSQDWNPVWEVKTGRFDRGWTMEAAVPFKSLRYRPGTAQVWGFNVMRTKRSKNEMSLLTKVPPSRGQAAMVQMSFAASLVGLEAPPPGRNIDLKPYATSSLTTNRNVTPQISNDPDADIGLDLKYAVTRGLSADVTINTDFAQVEADEQQINLTRFSLFFPEKREFFLENQGLFSFGGVQNTAQVGFANDSVAPILFYSRRIGLNEGRSVPLWAGGRMTGRAGRYSIGVLNVQTGDESPELPSAAQATNFSVVRLKRDVLRRSAIGLIATARSVTQVGDAQNYAYGVDGTFAFFENLAINTHWAQTKTTDLHGDDISYRAQLDYTGDRYGLQLEQLAVGDNFNPDVGFVRRDDMHRSFGLFRFSPRPKTMPSVRKFRYQGGVTYVTNTGGMLESRELEGEYAIEFQNQDQFIVGYSDFYEFLPEPFPIAPPVTIPVGGYDFASVRVGFNLGRQRRFSGNNLFEYGTFYNGHRTSMTVSQARVSITNALSMEPIYSWNKVDLVQGAFTTHLAGSRVTYTMTPLMFVSALIQYNSSTKSVSTNARLRWEYRPGSEFFVVYNDDRSTAAQGFPNLTSRALIVKVNRLFRY